MGHNRMEATQVMPRRVDLPLILVFEILRLVDGLPTTGKVDLTSEQRETVDLIKDHLVRELS